MSFIVGDYLFKKMDIKYFKIIFDFTFNLLEKFKKINKDMYLSYTMGGGLLIAEFIYKEMIPWDDDIDVYMTFKDLNTLNTFVKYIQDTISIFTNEDIKEIKFFNLLNENNTFIEYNELSKISEPQLKLFIYFNNNTFLSVDFLLLQFCKENDTTIENMTNMTNTLIPIQQNVYFNTLDGYFGVYIYSIYDYIDQRYPYCRTNTNIRRFWNHSNNVNEVINFETEDNTFTNGKFYYIKNKIKYILADSDGKIINNDFLN